IARYTVPPLTGPAPRRLHAVDVFVPRCNMTGWIRVYSQFDGKEVKEEDLLHPEQARYFDTAGIHSVPLDFPIEVEEGQTVAIWLRLTDEGARKRIPVSVPNARITSIPGVFNDIIRQGHYIFAAGEQVVRIDVNDPANPRIVSLLGQEDLQDEVIRLVPIGNRLVAGLYNRDQGDFRTLNTTVAVNAGSTIDTQTNYPFFVLDIYNPTSWRFVDLTPPRYADEAPDRPSGWWDHPFLGGGYEDRRRLLYNDPLITSTGNDLIVVSNRYQDRFEFGLPERPYWWDFTASRWDLTDPYNPTFREDRVFAYSSLNAEIEERPEGLDSHTYWYHDYDATGAADAGKTQDGDFTGRVYLPGYVVDVDTGQANNTDLIEKNPVFFQGNVNGERRACVASIVNSEDLNPRDNNDLAFPGDPGDILITDVSASEPVLLSTILAMDEVLPAENPRVIAFPAMDLAIVHDFLFVADGQGGVVVFDISDPRNPQKRAEYLTPNARRLIAWSHLNKPVYYIYAIDEFDGLVVLAYRGNQEIISVDDASYYSPTGEAETWVDLFEAERKSVVLRGRIGSDQPARSIRDVNNDGNADAVTFAAEGVKVALSNGAGFDEPAFWTEGFGSDVGWRSDRHPRMLGDVNADGYVDVVGFADNGVVVALGTATGDGFSTPTLWVDGLGYDHFWRIERHPRLLADVNGDGRDDAVGFGDRGVMVALSNGNGFETPTRWTRGFGYASDWRIENHPRFLADFNNDNRADVVGFADNGVVIAYSTGSSFLTPVLVTDEFGRLSKGWDTAKHPRLIGDVNGDGRADIVGFANRIVVVALGNNTGGVDTPSPWLEGDANKADPTREESTWFTEYFGIRVQRHPRILADVNGDGNDDIVLFDNGGVRVALSNGVNRFQNGQWWSESFGYGSSYSTYAMGGYYDGGWSASRNQRVLADVNGDNRADVVGLDRSRIVVGLSTGGYLNLPAVWLNPTQNVEGDDDTLYVLGGGVNAVQIGDVNGDGDEDYAILSGGAGIGLKLGNGALSPFRLDLSAKDAFFVETGLDAVSEKRVTSVRDVNGDGFGDFAIGVLGTQNGVETAKVYIIHGRAAADWGLAFDLAQADETYEK
ncbi:VCBS repeat-containing protein, partial [bacterium]|nr:VCBS repeat-containing protein [bacterium]